MSILQTQNSIQNSTTTSILNNTTSNMTVSIPVATKNKDTEDSTVNNKSMKEVQQDSVDSVMESPSDSTTDSNNTSSSSSSSSSSSASSQKPKRHRAPPPPLNIPPLRQSARSAVRFRQAPQVSVYNSGYIHSAATKSQTPTATTHFEISNNGNILSGPSANVTISASPSTSITSIASNIHPKSIASPISTESVTSSINLSSTPSGLARTRAPAPIPGNVQTPSSANGTGNHQQYQTISFPMHTQPILIPTTLPNGTVTNIVYQPTYNPLIPYAPQFLPQQMLTPMSNQEKTILGSSLSSTGVRTIGVANTTTANNISASLTTSNIPQSAKRTYFVSSNSDNELILTSPSDSIDPYKRQKTSVSPPIIRQAAALGYPNGITVVSSPIMPKMAVSGGATRLNTPLVPMVVAPVSSPIVSVKAADKQQRQVTTSKAESNAKESKEDDGDDDDDDDDEDDEDDVEANAIEDDAMATPFPKDAKDVKSQIAFEI
ncbi:unnamed protein product [[Candida] boidinii]|nr:unnamed protein product [[Candida] boidinii]